MWNLAQLASSLMPLIDDVEVAQASIDRFPELFQTAWLSVFRAKIGLQTEQKDDAALMHDLMDRMATGQADFTNTFRALGTDKARDEFLRPEDYDAWVRSWRARLAAEGATPEDRLARYGAGEPADHSAHASDRAGDRGRSAGRLFRFRASHAALATPFDRPRRVS